MSDNIKEKIEKLREVIRANDYKYFVENEPSISDYDYDQLMNELKELENEFPSLITPDSPTRRVGGEPMTAFNTVDHKIPMLSIDNTYSEEELREFDKRIHRLIDDDNYQVEYVVELKIDGIAISLWYENGTFVRGITRGNGVKGDDVTANIRTIKELPLRIPDFNKIFNKQSTDSLNTKESPHLLEIRGEVYLPNDDFEKLNVERKENDKPLLANPRNAAAGSLKLLDPRITAKRRLHLFAYEIGYSDGSNLSTHIDTLQFIKKLGLPVNRNYKLCATINDVINVCNTWETERRGLPYQVDGMVIKVNTLKLRDELGATGKSPRWLISYKFHPDQAVTQLNSITVQVGKSGILTPVANLTPVHLAGSTVSRATLHNFDELKRKDIRIGDYVTIQKAGDIIPQIVNVVKDKREEGLQEFEVPSSCPVCNGEIINSDNEVYIRCGNPSCRAQSMRRIEFFASRNCMDIEGLGPSIVELLVNNNLLKDCADVYSLKLDDLIPLERMADKSSKNLLNSIEKSKGRDLNHLICALGINNIGIHAADVLATQFGSLDALSETTEDRLKEIPEIGPVGAESIVSFFKSPETIDIITKLKEAGVNTKSSADNIHRVSPEITGKTFVITGSMAKYSRKELEDTIKKYGGKVSSSVSKKTNFVIAGESPGSKLTKAETLGVKIINEEEFESLHTVNEED